MRFLCLSCALLLLLAPTVRAQDEDGDQSGQAAAEESTPAPAPPVQLDEPFVDPLAGLAAEPVVAEPAPIFDLQELKLRFSGYVQTDLRFRLAEKAIGDFTNRQSAPSGVSRNENILKVKFDAAFGNWAAAADVDFVWRGVPERLDGVGDQARRETVDPYYLQAHALYLEASDWLLDGLDLRVGQQLVQWGKADQFNPTNNLNANDLEDILLFGDQLANVMLRLDYNAFLDWSLSGVLVPVFKPALVPSTAPLALAAVDRMPMSETGLRHRLAFENALSRAAGFATVVADTDPTLPATSFGNMQYSFRLAGSILEQDVAFSYYNGRNDFPQPVRNTTEQTMGQLCDPDYPDDPDHCVDGLLQTVVTLEYPKVQVIGFNMAGEIPLDWMVDSWGGLGYRLELGVYLPERVEIALFQGDVVIAGIPVPGGEYDYRLGGRKPTVIDDTPFAKWTVGLDYSFGSHFYVNLMWVHGLSDEFGAGDFFSSGYAVRESRLDDEDPLGCLLDRMFAQGEDQATASRYCGDRGAVETLRPRIGDYAVAIVDFKFDDDKALLRLFAMWDVSGYFEDRWNEAIGERERKYLSLFGGGFSGILYPEFKYNFGNGLELGFGALLQFGKGYTKFGDPAAGGSLVWTRARFSW